MKNEVKLPKGVTQEFVDSIQSMNADDLKALIVRLQLQAQENEEFKQSEEFVQEQDLFVQAKERFALINDPVKETALSLRNRTKLVVSRLKEKGQN